MLLHCFPRFRLGLLEPFPMYMAVPCSEYYGSSDFSIAFPKPLCIKLGFEYPLINWMLLMGEQSRSLLLTHKTSSHMPGSWTPPGLSLPRVIVRLKYWLPRYQACRPSGILTISRLDHFTPLKAFRPV